MLRKEHSSNMNEIHAKDTETHGQRHGDTHPRTRRHMFKDMETHVNHGHKKAAQFFFSLWATPGYGLTPDKDQGNALWCWDQIWGQPHARQGSPYCAFSPHPWTWNLVIPLDKGPQTECPEEFQTNVPTTPNMACAGPVEGAEAQKWAVIRALLGRGREWRGLQW